MQNSHHYPIYCCDIEARAQGTESHVTGPFQLLLRLLVSPPLGYLGKALHVLCMSDIIDVYGIAFPSTRAGGCLMTSLVVPPRAFGLPFSDTTAAVPRRHSGSLPSIPPPPPPSCSTMHSNCLPHRSIDQESSHCAMTHVRTPESNSLIHQ